MAGSSKRGEMSHPPLVPVIPTSAEIHRKRGAHYDLFVHVTQQTLTVGNWYFVLRYSDF